MDNQYAINLLRSLEKSLDDYCELNDEGKMAFNMAVTALEQPECKRGKWIHCDIEPDDSERYPLGWMPWYCSECGCGVGKHQTTFCPNCGADMRGE